MVVVFIKGEYVLPTDNRFPPPGASHHLKFPCPEPCAVSETTPGPQRLAPVVAGGLDGLPVIVIKSVWVTVLVPFALVDVSITSYMPALFYTTKGFCSVELEGMPTLNVQFHDVGEPVE